jgi:hypothetical protein
VELDLDASEVLPMFARAELSVSDTERGERTSGWAILPRENFAGHSMSSFAGIGVSRGLD